MAATSTTPTHQLGQPRDFEPELLHIFTTPNGDLNAAADILHAINQRGESRDSIVGKVITPLTSRDEAAGIKNLFGFLQHNEACAEMTIRSGPDVPAVALNFHKLAKSPKMFAVFEGAGFGWDHRWEIESEDPREGVWPYPVRSFDIYYWAIRLGDAELIKRLCGNLGSPFLMREVGHMSLYIHCCST